MGNNNDKNHPAELTRETRTRFLCLTAMTVCTSTLLLKHKKETRSQRGSTFVFRQKTLLVWLRKTQHLNHSLSYHFKTKKGHPKKKNTSHTRKLFAWKMCPACVLFCFFLCVCQVFLWFLQVGGPSVHNISNPFFLCLFRWVLFESTFFCLFVWEPKSQRGKKKKKLHFWTFFIKFPLVWRSSDWERSATR